MTEKQIIRVVQAYLEGKTIEACSKDNGAWIVTEYPQWDFLNCDYRVKGEKEYRPFKNSDEVMDAIRKHGGYVRDKESIDFKVVISLIMNDEVRFGSTLSCSYEKALDEYEFTDGTPFGVSIEE